MTISTSQQVDYLWKKVGFGLTKTSTPDLKSAANESIVSPLFLPGDQIWVQSGSIPSIIPTVDSDVVQVYSDATANTIRCVPDITAPVNRTWLTNQIDWIPPIVGPTYQPKVYLDSSLSTTPQTTGTQLFANGSNNDDEWFFDFQSGVLHFIGDNLPSLDFAGKSIFVCGARYVGGKGISSTPGQSFGNITIGGSTISSLHDIILDPSSANVSLAGNFITNLGYSTNPTSAATVQYVLDTVGNLSPNSISQLNSSVVVSDAGTGSIVMTLDGVPVVTHTATTSSIQDITISGTSISSVDQVVSIDTVGAIQVPVGTSADRPEYAELGYFRFNSDLGVLEFYDGATWVSTALEVESQILLGDKIAVDFLLNRASTTIGVMVMINGVVQIPYEAYNVSGTTITFAEPPNDTDKIEVRFISQLVASQSSIPNPVVISDLAIPVGVTSVVCDVFSTSAYRTAKYVVSASTGDGHFQTFDVTVVHNGSTASVLKSAVNRSGGTVDITFASSIQTGFCSVTATSTASNSSVKIQKTYFTV